MKKNLIVLIICAAAFIVVGGVYIALMMTDGDKNSQSASDTEPTEEIYTPVALFEFEKSDVKSVNVKNSEGEFVGIPDGEPDEDGNVPFTVEGIEDLDTDTANASSLLNSASALNTVATAEESASDLDKYGLSKPAAEVTVKAGAGEKSIVIGSESPISGQTYCMEKDGKAVYLVSTSNVSVFFNDKESFVSKTVLEQPDDEASPKVESIRVERTDIDYNMLFEYDRTSDDEDTKSGSMATHYMSEPVFAYLDAQKSTDTVNGFFGMSANSIIKIYPSEDEVAAVGLDKPFCTVTMKTDEPAERVLKIGKKMELNGGSYYPVMIDDRKVIYALSPDSVCWAELQPDDIISRLVFGVYVWDIGKLEVSADGTDKVLFEGSGSSEDDYKVTKNGKSCDTGRFRDFYNFLLKASAEELVLDGQKPAGSPIASVAVETQDGKTKQTVEFYPADGKKAMIVVNGKSFFKCRMAYVDLLISNLKNFDGSEEFVMNW